MNGNSIAEQTISPEALYLRAEDIAGDLLKKPVNAATLVFTYLEVKTQYLLDLQFKLDSLNSEIDRRRSLTFLHIEGKNADARSAALTAALDEDGEYQAYAKAAGDCKREIARTKAAIDLLGKRWTLALMVINRYSDLASRQPTEPETAEPPRFLGRQDPPAVEGEELFAQAEAEVYGLGAEAESDAAAEAEAMSYFDSLGEI